MTILEQIKAELDALEGALRSLLSTELGTFQNGQVAIYRGTVPVSLKTTGLRCTISKAPQGSAGDMRSIQQYWTVQLVNFSDTCALIVAKRKIESTFAMQRSPVYLESTDLNLEQCTFYLFSPRVYAMNPIDVQG